MRSGLAIRRQKACQAKAVPRRIARRRGLRESLQEIQRTLGNQHLQRLMCGLAAGPGKALGETDEESLMDKPDPRAGSATIQCDGKGGYEVVLNGWSGATCGTKDCVIKHESSHMADWKAKWPDGCKNQPQGYLPKGDPPDKPLMTVDEYKAFLKASECTAHTVDLKCAEALPKEGGCKTTVEDYIDLTKKQKAKWC